LHSGTSTCSCNLILLLHSTIALYPLQTSLGELRQEVGQVKQINTVATASRVGSQYGGIGAWPAAPAGNSAAGSMAYQQQLQQQQQQSVDPLVHSLSRRFTSITPTQHLDYNDAGAHAASELAHASNALPFCLYMGMCAPQLAPCTFQAQRVEHVCLL
jgi:hypothetical protein